MGIIATNQKRLFKKVHCSLLWVLLMFLLPASLKAQNDIITKVDGKRYYKHTVGKGETIYGIAKKFNLEPKDIVLENPSAMDGVKEGDVLLIPAPAKAAVADTAKPHGNYIYHEVLPKETLYSLAKQYNTTIADIDSLNPDIVAKGLQKGKQIRIPVVQPPAPPHPVQEKHPVLVDTAKPASPNKAAPINNPYEANAYKSLVIQQSHTDTAKQIVYAPNVGILPRYTIALIMPFTKEGSDTLRIGRLMEGSEQIPQIMQISFDFYHGMLMALDSLGRQGLKANLQVFNIDTSSDNIDTILKNPCMLNANLIIGPPYPSNFRKMALFAQLHHIPIISPLSPESNVLKNNPWTSKTTPSATTETEGEAGYILSHYKGANVILIHNRDANQEYYEAFKKEFQKTDSALGRTDTLHYAESIGGVSGLKIRMSKTGNNIIVMPYHGAPFVAKFVNELANVNFAYDDSITLFGMYSWTMNNALSADNLDTLNCHFPSNEFVNYSDSVTKKFINQYRNNYLSEPSYYSYQGYDAGMFYGNLLRMYGTDVQSHLGDNKYRGLQTSFNMVRINPLDGYENKTVYILEYKNYMEKLDWGK